MDPPSLRLLQILDSHHNDGIEIIDEIYFLLLHVHACAHSDYANEHITECEYTGEQSPHCLSIELRLHSNATAIAPAQT